MFFSDVFWGFCVMAIGLNILLDTFFGINIPFFRIGLALFCIYFGLQLLSKPLFNKNYFSFTAQKYSNFNSTTDYTTFFGKQYLDFSALKLTSPKRITISTTFGTTFLILNSALPTQIITHVNFGKIKHNLANKTFGNSIFLGPQDTDPLLIIEAYVDFGTLKIKNI